MKLIIDADEIAYKSSAHSTVWCSGLSSYKTKKLALECENISQLYNYTMSPQWRSVEKQIDSMILKYQIRLKATATLLVLSGSTNYRVTRYPDYKANRQGRERPFYLKKAREYIQSRYETVIADDQEGDDLMGILQTQDSIIVSSDKDMKTIPGWLYNPLQDYLVNISEYDADYNFYLQVLIGDVADGVKGVKGIGPVKANKILKGSENRLDMLNRVMTTYENNKLTTKDLDKVGLLLYIRRNPHDLWTAQEAIDGKI